MIDWIVGVITTLGHILPLWYIYIGVAFTLWHFSRALFYDFELTLRLLWRMFWNTLIVPLLMGLLWPLTLMMTLANRVWGLHNHWFFRQIYGNPKDADEERSGSDFWKKYHR